MTDFSTYALRILAADKGLTKDADPMGERFWVRAVDSDVLVAVMMNHGNAFSLARQLTADNKTRYSVARMAPLK